MWLEGKHESSRMCVCLRCTLRVSLQYCCTVLCFHLCAVASAVACCLPRCSELILSHTCWRSGSYIHLSCHPHCLHGLMMMKIFCCYECCSRYVANVSLFLRFCISAWLTGCCRECVTVFTVRHGRDARWLCAQGEWPCAYVRSSQAVCHLLIMFHATQFKWLHASCCLRPIMIAHAGLVIICIDLLSGWMPSTPEAYALAVLNLYLISCLCF